jgi:hypothetical protein
MTKQDLIKMMGSEDRAEYAMIQVLKVIKPDFIVAALKANKAEAERVYNERKASGYYTEFDGFPEDFNVIHEELTNPDNPLLEKYNNWEKRHWEEASDNQNRIAASNMYTHGMCGKGNLI